MLIKILLVISIIVQTLATAYALRLVRATKYNSVWILFIVGFSLLSVERFVQLLMAGGHYVPRWWFGYLGIVVSVCLSIGVMYAHKLFKYIDRLNRQRQLLNKRILTAVLRTEEKARSRFSKELHDGLGPLLSSARMSLSALSREERSADQREIIDNTTYVIDEAVPATVPASKTSSGPLPTRISTSSFWSPKASRPTNIISTDFHRRCLGTYSGKRCTKSGDSKICTYSAPVTPSNTTIFRLRNCTIRSKRNSFPACISQVRSTERPDTKRPRLRDA